MKRIVFLPATLALLSVSVLAQTRPAVTPATTPRPAAPAPASPAVVPQSKIAFVNTVAFADGTVGIRRLVNAVRNVDTEFKSRSDELQNMQSRLQALLDEVNRLNLSKAPVSPESIQAKNDEGQRLERDLKYKKDQLDSDYEKRYAQVVQPISSDIGRALDEYLLSHALTMILDISKLAPAVLSANPAMDITKDFIAEYNRKNP